MIYCCPIKAAWRPTAVPIWRSAAQSWWWCIWRSTSTAVPTWWRRSIHMMWRSTARYTFLVWNCYGLPSFLSWSLDRENCSAQAHLDPSLTRSLLNLHDISSFQYSMVLMPYIDLSWAEARFKYWWKPFDDLSRAEASFGTSESQFDWSEGRIAPCSGTNGILSCWRDSFFATMMWQIFDIACSELIAAVAAATTPAVTLHTLKKTSSGWWSSTAEQRQKGWDLE